jgi:deoxyribodipyrimidine photo-lyase
MGPIIVWFQNDLRLQDNPALQEALASGRPVVPLYIWSPEEEGAWPPGAASRWWLHHSLIRLAHSLEAHGSRLTVRRGPVLSTLCEMAAATGASGVFWNRRYEPAAMSRESQITRSLRESGIQASSFNASLLFEPSEIRNKSGMPFQVFTPFWKTCRAAADSAEPHAPPPLLSAHSAIPAPAGWPASLPLESLRLIPRIPWADGLAHSWQPGEAGAQAALQKFIAEALESYPEGRDRPGISGVSRLSPHLHFGEIGPWQVWRAVQAHLQAGGSPELANAAEAYLRQLGWREFAAHLLCHFPQTVDQPMRPEFALFPWRTDEAALKAWQQGRTGYPIVDAGMRELWETGWMHNRVRMIVASFLVKDLLIPWQAGAAWFWDTLVDADLANNTLGWQWTAGCGADAAPYFRIFNPVLQGMKFDPDGAYVRQWVPEIAHLPNKRIHSPHELSGDSLRKSDGSAYPAPIVDHRVAASRAMAAYTEMKNRRA